MILPRHTHTHTRARACAHMRVRTRTHTQTSCACTHTNTCMHVRTHTHPPTPHTHTHTQETMVMTLLRIYMVENILGKLQSSTFKSLRLLEMKIYQIKWLKNVYVSIYFGNKTLNLPVHTSLRSRWAEVPAVLICQPTTGCINTSDKVPSCACCCSPWTISVYCFHRCPSHPTCTTDNQPHFILRQRGS